MFQANGIAQYIPNLTYTTNGTEIGPSIKIAIRDKSLELDVGTLVFAINGRSKQVNVSLFAVSSRYRAIYTPLSALRFRRSQDVARGSGASCEIDTPFCGRNRRFADRNYGGVSGYTFVCTVRGQAGRCSKDFAKISRYGPRRGEVAVRKATVDPWAFPPSPHQLQRWEKLFPASATFLHNRTST